MGYALSWLAARGKTPAAVCRDLGLRPTGEREPALFWHSSEEVPLVATELPDGWYLVVANGQDFFADKLVLKALSRSCSLVSRLVEAHVMVSSASGWTEGAVGWAVTHDSRKGRAHLKVEGSPPPALAEIILRQRKKQAEADQIDRRVDCLFDIPVSISEHLTGFRHDRPESTEREFDVVTRAGR